MVIFAEFTESLMATVPYLKSTPLVVAYLSFVMVSPVLRRIFPPLNIRNIMVAYNFFCAMISLYSAVFLFMAIMPNFPHSLYDIETAEHPYTKHAFYVYWMTKIIELLDTVIMILRHRTRQISFLHVYHHTTILLFAEYSYTYGYSRRGMVMIVLLNSLVHVFLYYYYGLTAHSPVSRPFWKKSLTVFQLVQFAIGLVVQLIGYFNYNIKYCFYGIIYEVTMVILFSNFYHKMYVKTSQSNGKKVE